MANIKPMLAASCDDITKLRYPLLASPKYDGIRCLIIDGMAMSRSLKQIPNRFIQSILTKRWLEGMDGELIVGTNFQQSTSGIMSDGGQPDFRFYVFDLWNEDRPYHERIEKLKFKFLDCFAVDFGLSAFLVPVLPKLINEPQELYDYTTEQLALGYEGTMVRSPHGPYKKGRATFGEGYLTKIKPFEDADAEVVDFEEQMHNGNEATTNALGRTERSSHQSGLVPKGTLGALVCKNEKLWPGQTFNIGTGFNDLDRKAIWLNREVFRGKTVKFKYQKIGTVDKPRIPVFLGFRDTRDQ